MIAFPTQKYDVIYADPPWSYTYQQNLYNRGKKRGIFDEHISKHYNVMSFQQIYDLPVKTIAADRSLLFLWVVSPNLSQGIQTGIKWGFKYITVGFVWDKIGCLPGYYTMPQCELVLIFKRGAIPQPRGARNVKQFLSEKRTIHSRKPDEVRNRIDLMFPQQSKIELFAREKAQGWSSWGEEIGNLSQVG